jgi:hypothetical protein
MRRAVTTAAAILMRKARDYAIVVIEDDPNAPPDHNHHRRGRPPARLRKAKTPTRYASTNYMGHLLFVEDNHLVGIVDITDACRALVGV